MSLIFDWETRSPADLRNRGVYVYAEHPETDALLASFKLSVGEHEVFNAATRAWIAAGGPLNVVCRWRRPDPCPAYLRAYIEAGGEVCAFNAGFERLIWWNVATPKYGWPKPRLEQFRCTAVTAAAMALPRSLDRLGDALGLKIKKDKAGSGLIKIHSVPVGFDYANKAVWHPLADDPASLERFHAYCDIDVLAEEEAHNRLVPLSDMEMQVYWLNERINDRGLRIDTRSAHAALKLADSAKEKINAELCKLTDGAVTAVTLTARMKEWIHSQGVDIAAMDKDEIDDTLHLQLPDNVRRALELRIEGGKASVEKVAAMLRSTTRDGTIKGVFLHHGAGQTGRFSSKLCQVHNMPRPRKVYEDAHVRRDVLFDALREGSPEIMDLLYGDTLGRTLHLLADALRSFIWAAPNHRFIGGDFSSIEGRVAAWYGRETWKLNAYRELDAGRGAGLYETAAAGIYNVPVKEVTKQQRQVGKVAELALGFGGGAGALSRMARANKMDLAVAFPTLWEITDDEGQEKAERRYEENLKRGDTTAQSLTREAYLAAELIKTAWRTKHPGTVQAWRSLMDAAFTATQNPGEPAAAIGLPFARYIVAHGFLWLQLPSGRCLAYGVPEIRPVEVPWADKSLEPAKREKQPAVTVRGVGANNTWMRYPLNISICYNNLVQATARDLLVHAMLNVEEAGYPVKMHVHDEIVAELPNHLGSVKEFEELMCRAPKWAAGLPMAAAGFTLKRYAKT